VHLAQLANAYIAQDSFPLQDSSSREHNVTQWFSLDGTVPPLQLFPELLLLTDLKSLVSTHTHSHTHTGSTHIAPTHVELAHSHCTHPHNIHPHST